MSKSSQSSLPQHKPKNRPKQEPPARVESQPEISAPGSGMSADNLQGQADLLGNPDLPDVQRQRLAEQIGSRQGNVHLQRVLARLKDDNPAAPQVMREPQPGVTAGTPTEEDYRFFVDSAIRFFEGAGGFFTATPVRGRPAGPSAQQRAEAATPEATLREIARILEHWQQVYENARGVVTGQLNGDRDLSDRLRTSYAQAIETLHRSARDRTPRVNINLIAAPGRDDDQFIANAAAYARTYYNNPPRGDVVITVENIRSLDELLGTIERTQPERMIRRVDIFAHGTIQPSNQLKLAGRWHTGEQIEQAATAREFTSQYIRSIARFDENSRIEIHGCRIGGGEGQDFLTSAGRALGGRHNQQITGYTERWFPRRYQVTFFFNRRGRRVTLPVLNTEQDVYGDNSLPIRNGVRAGHQPFIRHFEQEAIRLFDTVVAGSLEVQRFLTTAERQGDPVTRDRKIEIMRAMYDVNQAWMLGFLHPAQNVPDLDPTQAIGRQDYTFTREREAWENRVLNVQIQP